MNSLKIITLVSLVTVLIAGGCGNGNGDTQKTRIIPVTVAPVEYGEFTVPIYTSARLEAGTEMKLSFKTGGVVDKFNVDEGDRVREGQVLASLKLAEAKAQAEMAISSLEKARRDLERIANLYNDGVATLEQKQNTETAVRVAEAQAEIAKFNLEHSVIAAPADGIVLKRLVEINELVAPGTPVLFVGTTGDGWSVSSGVTDRDAVRLNVGDSASIVFDTYAGETFAAKVTEIAESPDPRTGTYEIKMTLKPTKTRLLSGFSAKATIYPPPIKSHFLVPIDALMQADEFEGAVYTIDNADKAKRIDVKINYILDDRIAIATGLEQVDGVITRGVAYVDDGTPVEILNQPAIAEKR